jgi:hypothetical protein
MTASFNTTHCVPGNYVADSLGDLQMAVRADPSFIFIGICSNAGLSRVGNASSGFFAAYAHSQR